MTTITSELISIIPELITLIAAIGSPFFTLFILRKRIILPARTKWLDDLRKIMSLFLVECRTSLIMTNGNGLFNQENLSGPALQNLLLLEQELILMLNPEINNHLQLIKILENISDYAQHGSDDLVFFGAKIHEATELCRNILDTEWRQIKSTIF